MRVKTALAWRRVFEYLPSVMQLDFGFVNALIQLGFLELLHDLVGQFAREAGEGLHGDVFWRVYQRPSRNFTLVRRRECQISRLVAW